MDISTIYTNADLEETGVWFDYRDDSQVLVASLANGKFQRYSDHLRKPYERQRQIGALGVDKETELLCKALARHVVLDWKNFEKDGKPLPYSEKAAFQLLMDSRVFRNDMVSFAAENEAYRIEKAESAEKNSVSTSGLTSKSDKKN